MEDREGAGGLERTFREAGLVGEIDDDIRQAVSTDAFRTLCVLGERATRFSSRVSRSAAVLSLGGRFSCGETCFTAESLAAGMQGLLALAATHCRTLVGGHQWCESLLSGIAADPSAPGLYIASTYPSHFTAQQLEWTFRPEPRERALDAAGVVLPLLQHVFCSWSHDAPATKGVQQWLAVFDELTQVLYAATQFSGPPPRGPELCSANQHRLASGARSSVDWLREQQAMVICVAYNKATHRRDRPSLVMRVLPPRLSHLLALYVTVVSRMALAFRSWGLRSDAADAELASMEDEHGALFVYKGMRMTARAGHAAVERLWGRVLDCPTTSRSLRHLFAFLTRNDKSPLVPIIAAQEGARPMQAVRELFGYMAPMFGHSKATHRQSYGQDAAGDAAAAAGEGLDERVSIMRAFESLFGIAQVCMSVRERCAYISLFLRFIGCRDAHAANRLRLFLPSWLQSPEARLPRAR